ncbi:hypothetical protein [Persephonella sp.]
MELKLEKSKGLDDTVFKVLRDILGSEKFEEFKDFLEFYKINYEVDRDNNLTISIYFSSDGRWVNVAKCDTETGRIEKLVTSRDLISKINNENLIILTKLENDIKRKSTIILSIISFLIGGSIGIIILQII